MEFLFPNLSIKIPMKIPPQISPNPKNTIAREDLTNYS
jgi:hypothetical protein